MLGFESRSIQFFFFLSLKFSKFMPVLFIGTGAGAVDTAKIKIPVIKFWSEIIKVWCETTPKILSLTMQDVSLA